MNSSGLLQLGQEFEWSSNHLSIQLEWKLWRQGMGITPRVFFFAVFLHAADGLMYLGTALTQWVLCATGAAVMVDRKAL